MSDDALRGQERRLQQGDDPADEARLLAGALRAGRLAPERLALAAFLGHTPAREALGGGAREDLAGWLAALDEAGRAALAQAAVAGLRAGWGDVPSPRADLAQALRLLEGWAGCPCEAHAAPVIGMEPGLAGVVDRLGVADARARFARRAQDAARAVGALAGLSFGDDPLEACILALRGASAPAAPLVRWALDGPGAP